MIIKLKPKEKAFQQELKMLFSKLTNELGVAGTPLSSDERAVCYNSAADAALALARSLSKRDINIKWSEGTLSNRSTLDAKTPGFYRHYHSIQDLLHFLETGEAFTSKPESK